MKLKINKTFKLANPIVSIPHWQFTEGQILDTDNEYLIDRLLNLKCADILDKGNNIKKMPEPENKMVDTSSHENKEIEIVVPKEPSLVTDGYDPEEPTQSTQKAKKKVVTKKKGS